MDIEELIKDRRTIHEFANKPVDQKLVNKALELAAWAPNHKLTFPWIFYDLGPDTRHKLIELSLQLKQEKKSEPLSETKKLNVRHKLGSCSNMIALGLKKVDDEFQYREDYASMACAVQNMSLFLWDKGIGSKWSTGGFTSHSKTYQILGVDSSQVEIVGMLLIGAQPEKVRTPLRPKYTDLVKCRP